MGLRARAGIRLIVSVSLGVALLAGCVRNDHGPLAEAGTVDLRGWDFRSNGIAELDGQWKLYWGRFDDPKEPAAADGQPVLVPAPWNTAKSQGAEVGPYGFGTYRLQVQCRDGAGLALSLPWQHSATRWFVNGVEVASQGKPGMSREAAQTGVTQQIAHLRESSCPLDIAVHVSNFELRRGGLMRSVELGDSRQMHDRRELAVTRDVGVLGGLVVTGVLPLLFFLGRRQDRTPLYFGIFCLVFALGMGLSGTRVLQPLFMPLGAEGYLRLVFLCWCSNNVFYLLFLRSLYPAFIGPRAVGIMIVWAVLSCLTVLVTTSREYVYLLPFMTASSVLIGLYLTWRLAAAWRGGERGAALLLGGLLLFAIATAHDALNFQHLSRLTLLPYGILLFVAAPAWLMAQRFLRALTVEERVAIEQRERADLIVRSTNAGVLDWDAISGRTTYSLRYREMLGYPAGADAPDPPPFRELLHPDDHDKVHGSFMQQLRDRSVRSGIRANEPMDYRMRRRDGEYLWIHAEAVSVCGADGRTLRFICSFIDISQAKRHEMEMGDRIKFIDDLFDSVPVALSLRDPDGRYLFVNRTWEHNIGLARERVIGTSVRDRDDPAAAATLALDREALELPPGQTAPSHEFDYNGRRYLQTRTVMVDSQGQRIGVLAASLDITENHATRQALWMERERLRLLVRSTKAGFGDWDAQSDVVTYTDRFKAMLGYPPDTDTSRWPSIFDMMHPADVERARGQFRAMIRRKDGPGEQEPGEAMSYRLRRRDGSYIWIHAEGISQVDEEGRTRRFITSYLDVTQFREQEEALRASNERIAAQAALLEAQNETLKENVRLREEVERISRHDIKTPLNSIVAVPRLLREERRLGAEADELLGIVERAGYRILSMVNLSLDMFKMEQGSYIFRPDAVDLPDLANKVLADVRMHAASKQVLLQVELGQVPYAWAEELLCYSLLANLLKNAVEASPEGGVVTLRAEAGEDDTVVLHLHNAGVVPEAIRGNFFQKYATVGKASGTGLGTYSARLMARVQDGDIAMRTSDDEGTTLSVTLRAAPAGAIPATIRHAESRHVAEAMQVSAMPPLRILLVDDDEYNLLIVRRFLPSPPFVVDTAINGRVALAAAELQWPDVVFMDLDMPVMGGLEAVQGLRAMQRARLAGRCTMVALSSHDDDETRNRALAAGFDKYLTKPVTREVIHESLLELELMIGEAAAPAPTAPARPAPAEMDDPIIADPDVEPVLGEFVASRRELLVAMAAAMEAGNRGEVRRLAHQLAGSFALYGFLWASDQCKWVEHNFSEVEPEHLALVASQLARHLETAEVRFEAA
ncbi:MAG TPA: PAS domain S-box protein [Ramlibacter sp.]|nr:PAS domain S-box protein [Ramlibacter sp.]